MHYAKDERCMEWNEPEVLAYGRGTGLSHSLTVEALMVKGLSQARDSWWSDCARYIISQLHYGRIFYALKEKAYGVNHRPQTVNNL